MQTYDIYLSQGCSSLPELTDLIQSIPEVKSSKFQSLLLKEHPGFLNVDLSLEIARLLLRRLKAAGQNTRGFVAPSKYRKLPIKFTEKTAYPIAEKTLKQKQLQYPSVKFNPVQFAREELMWFVFIMVAEEWIQAGRIPGGLIVCVDKLDGHIWQDDEFRAISGE